MPTLETVITRLRPTSGRAVDLAISLGLATASAAEQDTAVTRAKAARDDALLDAETAVLRKAEQTLADAREQAERLNAIVGNLTARHVAAVEAEMVGDLEAANQRVASAHTAMNSWWTRERAQLVKSFREGLALAAAVDDSAAILMGAELKVRQAYPDRPTSSFQFPAMAAEGWARDLGDALRWLADYPRDVAMIGTLCDPRPPVVGATDQTYDFATGRAV